MRGFRREQIMPQMLLITPMQLAYLYYCAGYALFVNIDPGLRTRELCAQYSIGERRRDLPTILLTFACFC